MPPEHANPTPIWPSGRWQGCLRRIALLALSVLLGTCTVLRIEPPVNPEWEQRRQVLSDIEHWEFTGTISIRDDDESHSSRIRWRQQQEAYRVNLWGALNIGATEINGHPGYARIQQQGEEPLETASPERLIHRELGYELPVAHLNYWLKGIPAPGAKAEPRFGESNQLTDLQQSGWQIEYMAYRNYGPETLPVRIRMEKPPLQVDLLRMSWNLDPDD